MWQTVRVVGGVGCGRGKLQEPLLHMAEEEQYMKRGRVTLSQDG